MVFQNLNKEAIDCIDDKLIELYKKFEQGIETEQDIKEHEELIKPIFSNNMVFLRQYLGFVSRMKAYTREEFAKLLNNSPITVKWWELGNGIPNYYSIKSILRVVNETLQFDPPLNAGDLFCRNITRYILQRSRKRNQNIDKLINLLLCMDQSERKRFINQAIQQIQQIHIGIQGGIHERNLQKKE